MAPCREMMRQGPTVWGTADGVLARAGRGGGSPAEGPLASLQVLLPFAGVCIVCAILSHLHIHWELLDLARAQLSWANSTFHAPWVRIPYTGVGRQGWVQPSAFGQGLYLPFLLALLQASGGGRCSPSGRWQWVSPWPSAAA